MALTLPLPHRKKLEPVPAVAGYLVGNPEENAMDHDRIKGAANQAKGSLKEAAGKATGDAKLQAEGKADKIKGKVQNAVGGMKDSLRENKDD